MNQWRSHIPRVQIRTRSFFRIGSPRLTARSQSESQAFFELGWVGREHDVFSLVPVVLPCGGGRRFGRLPLLSAVGAGSAGVGAAGAADAAVRPPPTPPSPPPSPSPAADRSSAAASTAPVAAAAAQVAVGGRSGSRGYLRTARTEGGAFPRA